MAERKPEDWRTYLDELIVLWDKFPPDFKIHNKGKADVESMRGGLDSGISARTSAANTLMFSDRALDALAAGVNDFASHVLPAIEGQFGVDSVEAEVAPRKQLPDHHGGGSTSGSTLNTPIPPPSS
ncbi:MAG: hypothetical protein AUJ92_00315 [Armatimonadetes bacterium CG2_30_59_28]|nr:hypothetical protein [Armatimonadota bacterium]OIO99016.1 MAG: hypothetical protein AUJ92_00315 [Armatimonadetes bacterium CG2_30_59_28]PIX42916.1 MAG: hypothetical protein COZ56_08275 [Armatimonadetes bacterium CG_4_8_14_3_um_filter_58_9]PJB68699.1 MAG: hypothetical protein CO095_10945 [Armatimonadetes bacterium CG_4_9_14_3_um_filter_58_7]